MEIANPSNKKLEAELNQHLDSGESAAIALEKELNPDFLAIDEKKGRGIAESLGIPIIGLIGIIIVVKQKGIVRIIKPILVDLRSVAGFRISKSLYTKVLKSSGESAPKK